MGVAVTAYSKLVRINCDYDAEGEPIDPVTREPINQKYLQVFVNNEFSERALGLTDEAIYSYAASKDVFGVLYSFYNRWRDELAKMAGWPLGHYTEYGTDYPSYAASAWGADSGPFWELINFSDCEGTIDAVVCKKLANDFSIFDDKARNHVVTMNVDNFYSFYQRFRAGVELAADGGAIIFS